MPTSQLTFIMGLKPLLWNWPTFPVRRESESEWFLPLWVWGGGTCCVFYKPRNHGLILLEKKCFGVCVCVFNCIKWRNKIPGVWNWLTAKCLKTQEMKISSTVWVFWPISAESLLEMFCSVITRNAEYGTLDQYCCFLVPYMQSLRGTGSPFPHWLPNSEWQHLVPWGRAVAEQSIYFLKMNMQIIPLTF